MIYEERMKPTLEDYGRDGKITAKGVLRMLENIAAYHSDSLGYGAGTMDKTGISWILLEWNVRILRMPDYGEVLRVATWSRGRASRFTSLRDFEIYGADGEVCAAASSKWALIDYATKKPAGANAPAGLCMGGYCPFCCFFCASQPAQWAQSPPQPSQPPFLQIKTSAAMAATITTPRTIQVPI